LTPNSRRSRHAARAAGLATAVAVAATAGAAGGAPRQVGPLQPVIGNDSPAWSPDGSTIVYTSFRHGLGELYAVAPDGRGERRLTDHAAHDDQAAWSPDGTRIAFVSSRNGNPEIYVMRADGADQRRVTRSPAREYYPTWSPDGRRIAFQSDRTGRPQVFAIDADGTNEAQLTTHALSSGRPAWSPRGPIAFSSNREGSFKIFLMEPDGSDVRRLDRSASHLAELEPAWSPDGGRLAFVALRDPPIGNQEVYVVDADGGGTRRVTAYWGRDVSPSWSPDGRIAFTRGPSAFRAEVWVVNADGSALRQLTTTAVQWQVVRPAATPARPAAGRRFTLTAVVAEPTGDPVERAALTCRARVDGRALRAAVRRWQPARATCAWDVPRGTAGQTLRFGFEARAGRSGVSHVQRLVVR